MSEVVKITNENILEQIKLSCKIPYVIEEIINRQILENTSEAMGITVEVAELQKAADQMRLANKLDSADDTWAWLEKHGLSLEEFEKILYNSVIAGKLAVHLFADKVEQHFFQHQLDYAAVVLYEVVLDDEDLALELFYAIQEGEMSFHDVAHKYIQDQELRRSGGYRGILSRKDLKAEISAATFAAKPPQLLKPIVNSQGFYLIFVEEIIQPKLDNKLHMKIVLELFSEWMKQQREQVEASLTLSSIN